MNYLFPLLGRLIHRERFIWCPWLVIQVYCISQGLLLWGCWALMETEYSGCYCLCFLYWHFSLWLWDDCNSRCWSCPFLGGYCVPQFLLHFLVLSVVVLCFLIGNAETLPGVAVEVFLFECIYCYWILILRDEDGLERMVLRSSTGRRKMGHPVRICLVPSDLGQSGRRCHS